MNFVGCDAMIDPHSTKNFAGFDLPRAGGLHVRLLLKSTYLPNQMLQQSVVVKLGN